MRSRVSRIVYLAVIATASVVVIGPSALAWSGGFIAWPPLFPTAIAPGDHLQTTYYVWLWKHALVTLDHLPWTDVFQFAAGGPPTVQPFGWPLAIVSVPVTFVAGPVAAYNALVAVGFVGSAAATTALARAVGVSRPAAWTAGLAFALAPFRLVQAATHVNALLSPLLPLELWLVETALRGDGRRSRLAAWGAAAVHVSIVASGELHLAIFATMLLAWWLVWRVPGHDRPSLRPLIPPTAALVVGTALVVLLVSVYVLAPSVAAGGRSPDAAAFHAPRAADVIERDVAWRNPTFERYAYPGLAIAVLAAAGVAVGLRSRARATLMLAALAVGAYVLALAPAVPWLRSVYRLIPFLRFTRTPGRVLIVGALALALLGALALDRARGRTGWVLAAVAMLAIVVDAPRVFASNPLPDEPLAAVPDGAIVLHLPVFDPGHFTGAVYTYLLTQHPAPMPGGYSPFVTPGAEQRQERFAQLADPNADACAWRHAVINAGVTHVAVHTTLFGPHELQWPGDGDALARSLSARPGFARVSDIAGVEVFEVTPRAIGCAA